MNKRFIFFDTETTGVKADKDRIIEIAAYDALNEKSFSSLINPKCDIPKEATNIHNITNEMVKDAPTFEKVGQDFIDFCSEGAILVAHNNDSFDRPFLENEMKRSNLEIPAWDYLDSLKWSRKYRYDLPRHALQFLREVYEIEANQAHRALDDVIVLHKVFMKMIGDLKPDVVLELMNQSTTTRMPFGKYQGRPLKEVPKDYVNWLNEKGFFDKKGNEELKEGFSKLGILTC